MPKKKPRSRKPAPRRSGGQRSEQWKLDYSPARTMQLAREADILDEAMEDMLAVWPYRTVDASDRGPSTCLRDVAAQAKVSIHEAAENLIALEEADLLYWDQPNGRYLMLTPIPKDPA